jgi:hypothetical protein
MPDFTPFLPESDRINWLYQLRAYDWMPASAYASKKAPRPD